MSKYKLINIEDLLTKTLFSLAALVVALVTIFSALLSDLKFLLPFYVVCGNLFLSALVYLRGPKSRINASFSLTTVFIAFWTFSIYMYTQSTSASSALEWSRISGAISSLIPVCFAYFAYVFPKEEKTPSTGALISWMLIALAFFSLYFTDLIVKGAYETAEGYRFSTGPLFVFFMIHFVSFTAFGFYELFKKHAECTGISRMQIRYVFLGFLLGGLFPIATNIIFPFFGVVELSGYGPFFTIITIAFVAYSIVRHRLMSIELVIQKGVIYAFVAAFIMAVYAFAIFASERFFRETVGYSSFILTAAAAIVIAILYQPILKLLQDVTNRIFFKGHYDYQKTLREASSAIASIIQLDQLTKIIVSTFTETMMVSEISLLLFDASRKKFKSAQVELKGASRYRQMEIDEASPIISFLKKGREMLIRDELDGRISKAKNATEQQLLLELKDEVERVGVTLWVPIVSKEELVGVIASGSKLSGEIFTSEDLGLLETLANQTAVALDNARLYEEIVSMKTYSEDILKSMTNGVLTTDLKGKVVTFNSMAEKMTGKSAADVVSKNIDDTWGEGVIVSAVKGTLRGQFYSNYEAGLIRGDRAVIPVSISTTLLRDSRGKSIGALCVISDLSEVKELEGKVRQADKLAALGTMAAGMAHEIKNPLSSMKVLSQLMPLKFSDETYRKRFEEIMPREISRIDRIVESLLGFARATSPKFTRVALLAVVEEILKYFTDDIERRKIKVLKDFAKVPDIEADAGQLSQVFSNLVLNAIQAMPEGGELKIVIAEGKKKEGVIEGVLISVSDTGYGVPREFLAKLFDPFFTTKHGGTGLGLTIAHSIVDGHKGSINVSSEPGRGTTFRVTLPVSQ